MTPPTISSWAAWRIPSTMNQFRPSPHGSALLRPRGAYDVTNDFDPRALVPAMTLAFIAAVTAMLIVALVLILLSLLRGNSGTPRRLRESRAELRALDEARAAGSLEAADYA